MLRSLCTVLTFVLHNKHVCACNYRGNHSLRVTKENGAKLFGRLFFAHLYITKLAATRMPGSLFNSVLGLMSPIAKIVYLLIKGLVPSKTI